MKKLQDKPFVLLGVHVGGSSPQQLKKIIEKEHLTWRSFVDEGNAGRGPIAVKWNHTATPTFYLIDHTGVIRRKWAGPPGGEALDAAVETLVKKAETEKQD